MGNCYTVPHKSFSPCITLSATTWLKDQHELIDYTLHNLPFTTHKISAPCKVIFNGGEVVVRDSVQKNAADISLLGVGYARDKFWIYKPAEENINSEQIWIILKGYASSYYESGVKLKQNDIVKLGRCQFLVKELVKNCPKSKTQASAPVKTSDIDIKLNKICSSFNQIPTDSPAKPKCRICLESDATESNPMMTSPCKCSGTIKLMHVGCLQKWLQSKIEAISTDCVKSYYWQNFECDVCKEKYPSTILCPNGKPLDIVNIQKPETNDYIVLESVSSMINSKFRTY